MAIELKFDAQYNTPLHPDRKEVEFNELIRQGDVSFLEDILQREAYVAPELLRAFFQAYIAHAISTNIRPGEGLDAFGNTIEVGPGPAPTLHLKRGHPTEDPARMYLIGAHQDERDRTKALEQRAESLALLLAKPDIEWRQSSAEGAVYREATFPRDYLQSQGFRALPKGGVQVSRLAEPTGPEFYQEVMRRFSTDGKVVSMSWSADKVALSVVQQLSQSFIKT